MPLVHEISFAWDRYSKGGDYYLDNYCVCFCVVWSGLVCGLVCGLVSGLVCGLVSGFVLGAKDDVIVINKSYFIFVDIGEVSIPIYVMPMYAQRMRLPLGYQSNKGGRIAST